MKILLTAGPTREAIDPVRYISNRSSGKMGYAIAAAACEAGHDVTLVTGPVALAPPSRAHTISIESAAEMLSALRQYLPSHDLLIMCAAVADYRPRQVLSQKHKKNSDTDWHIALEPVPDILRTIASEKLFSGITIGFAAETEELQKNALEKMQRKGCTLIVANDVSRRDIGFESDLNEVTLYFADGRSLTWPRQEKKEIGKKLVEIAAQLVAESSAVASTPPKS